MPIVGSNCGQERAERDGPRRGAREGPGRTITWAGQAESAQVTGTRTAAGVTFGAERPSGKKSTQPQMDTDEHRF